MQRLKPFAARSIARPAKDRRTGVFFGNVSRFEFATVLVIVGSVAAILGPVARRAGASFRGDGASTCASNLHVLGQGFAQYATDNDGFLPAPEAKGGGTGWSAVSPEGRSATLDGYLGKQGRHARSLWACSNLSREVDADVALPARQRFLRFARTYSMNQYLATGGHFSAPVLNPAYGSAASGEAGASSQSRTLRHDFAVDDPDSENPASNPDGARLVPRLTQGILASRVPFPGTTTLLFEGIPEAIAGPFNGYVKPSGDWTGVGGYYRTAEACTGYIGYSGATCQSPGLTPWHQGTNNYLYCDGHVASHEPVRQDWKPSRADPGEFLVTHCRVASAPCP